MNNVRKIYISALVKRYVTHLVRTYVYTRYKLSHNYFIQFGGHAVQNKCGKYCGVLNKAAAAGLLRQLDI